MDDLERRRIVGQKEEDFSESERQFLRYISSRFLDEFPHSSVNLRRQREHDALHKVFGWIPPIIMNWKKVLAAIAIALFLGGQPLINSVTIYLERLLP